MIGTEGERGKGETDRGRGALGIRVWPGLRPLGELGLLLQLRLAIIGGSEHRGAVTCLKVEQNQSACGVPWRGRGQKHPGQFGGDRKAPGERW